MFEGCLLLPQAHGGGVIFHEGKYYWFGEHKGGVTYVKYSAAYVFKSTVPFHKSPQALYQSVSVLSNTLVSSYLRIQIPI